MDDLISRQKAIDAIHCDITVIGKENAETVARTIGEFVDRIKALPTAQQEQQWIPCSERMPEDYVDVLVWFEYFRYGNYNRMYATHGIGNYSKEYNSWTINHETGWKDLHVFAWMPLPGPYEEAQND